MRGIVFGTEQRVGLWILPLFLVVGLLGATLAGALAVLHYREQVVRLQETTAAARAHVDQARNEVTDAVTEAQAAIGAQVEAVEERLAENAPLSALSEAGIYAVSASHPTGEVRVGTAFAVFSDEGETYLVTNYRVVATQEGFALPSVEVFLPQRSATVAVHNFDTDRDLAVLVAKSGPLPVLPWRPGDEALTSGDGIYLAGVAGQDTGAIIKGTIGGASRTAIVPALVFNAFLSGGPLLDGAGRVVAVSSLDFAPFGVVRGDLRYAVPIRQLCVRLIRCTEADVGPPPPPDTPVRAGRAVQPRPEPTPTPVPAEPTPYEEDEYEPSPTYDDEYDEPPPTDQPPSEPSAPVSEEAPLT